MATNSYVVTGMTCGSCASKVTAAVETVPGVQDIDVDIASGELSVSGESVEDAAVREAIAAAGYKVA